MCEDVAMSLMTATAQWRADKDALYDAMTQAALDGISDPEITTYDAGVVEYNEANVVTDPTQLSILTVIWDANDCWNAPSDTGDTWGGGSSGGSSGSGKQWVSIQVSYDAGATWETVWEGYVDLL